MRLIGLVSILLFISLNGPLVFAEGRVVSGKILSADGKPISGAKLFIDFALTNKAPCQFCVSDIYQSDHVDTSDQLGNVSVRLPDADNAADIIVLCDGYQQSHIMIQRGAQAFKLVLTPRKLRYTDDKHAIRGRLVDPDNRPVVNAIVKPDVVANSRNVYSGNMEWFDNYAVTNSRGEFSFNTERINVELVLIARAEDLAHKMITLASGAPMQEFKLDRGTTISGRVVKDGEPLADIVVGLDDKLHATTNDTLVGYERLYQHYFANKFTHYRYRKVKTNSKGEFSFSNVPFNGSFVVCAETRSLGDLGVTAVKEFETDSAISALAIGELEVVKGQHISGRVYLADGRPLTGSAGLSIMRYNFLADEISIQIDEKGRFEIDNLALSSYFLRPLINGYRVAAKNQSVCSFGALLGRVTEDNAELMILLDKQDGRGINNATKDEVLKDQPLKGIESYDLKESAATIR